MIYKGLLSRADFYFELKIEKIRRGNKLVGSGFWENDVPRKKYLLKKGLKD